MYFKRCEIRNFRSIRELDISFDMGLQILVGLNESGKSNILKALAFIHPSVLPESDDVRDPRHDEEPVEEAYIRFVFGFDKSETAKFYENIRQYFQAKKLSHPIIKLGSKDLSLSEYCDRTNEGVFKVELISKVKGARHWSVSRAVGSAKWKKIPPGWSELSKFDNKLIKFISISDYPEYENSSDLVDIGADDVVSLVGAQVTAHINENLPTCVNWHYSESNLLPSRIDIEKFRSDPSICLPLRNIFLMAGHEDIATSVSDAEIKSNGMTNLLRRLSDVATRHLRNVWPEYRNVSIKLSQNGPVIEAGIEDEYNLYSVARRSDGFKRFIAFLLAVSAEAKAEQLKKGLIIIDEPDVGLHPSGVQYLRKELLKISEKNNVFVATHSIFMVDKERIDRHIIVRKQKEETSIVSDYSSNMLDEEVIFKALGYSFYEILKKRNVIFEGWTDKHAFTTWLSSRSARGEDKDAWKDIGMIHSYGAKDVRRVASDLENLDREYVVITDADTPAIEYKRKFDGLGKWLTFKDLGFDDKETIEDFIDSGLVNQKISQVFSKEYANKKIDIREGSTFNAKLSEIFNALNIERKERERLGRLIKVNIMEAAEGKHLMLAELSGKIIADAFEQWIKK